MPQGWSGSGSVRQSAIPICACCATEVRTFCPVSTQLCPSRPARVSSPARSAPADGSLNNWHAMTSPGYIAGR